MSEMEAQFEETIPKRAIFKTKGSTNATIDKREQITWPANGSPVIDVPTGVRPPTVQFLLSGEVLLDMGKSFFQLQLKTNTWSAAMNGGITSLFKSITIKLPSNGNQILEKIENLHILESAIRQIHCDEDSLLCKWNSGDHLYVGDRRAENLAGNRRFTNLNKSGYRMFTFQLNASAILGPKMEKYFPLFLMNGVQLEIELNRPEIAFTYNPAEETWGTLFDLVEGLPAQSEYDGLADDNARLAVNRELRSFYERPDASGQTLTYTIKDWVFVGNVIWMNQNYVSALVKKAESSEGFSITYDTFHMNRLNITTTLHETIVLTDQFQNLRSCMLVAVDRRILDNGGDLYSKFLPYLESFKYRVGARIWETIDNASASEAQAYTQTLISANQYGMLKANSMGGYKGYPRNKNVFFHTFQRSDDGHSGIDTRDSKFLRLNFSCRQQPEVALPMGANPYVIQTALDPVHCTLLIWMKATHMLNISSRGIAVTQ